MESSDEEPDFTYLDVPDRCIRPTIAEIDKKSGNERLSRMYSPEDLIAVETDPSCKADWFLAAYWPVYVGNFKVVEWDETTWYDQISDYFAYNGLLTRMIYIHHKDTDKDFATYQRLCMLIDMLVYFPSKADADRAIATCHRDSYYGYKLNVLPGRDPVFFDNEKSVQFVALGDSFKINPIETVMDRDFSMHGPVSFAGRYTNHAITLEFVSNPAMVAAVASQLRWKPVPLKGEFMKQRFLEEDVKLNIEWARDSNPMFMDMQPKASVLVQLFQGVRPNIDTPWKGYETFCKAPALHNYHKNMRKRFKRKFSKRKHKIVKPEIKPEIKIETKDPSLPPPKSKKQKSADNMKSINWFLRKNGAMPITRAIVRETKAKVRKQLQGK